MAYPPFRLRIPEGMKPTIDPWVVIEEQRPGYIRYRGLDDGRRWEVLGTCAWTDATRHGPCQEGSPEPPLGPPEGRLDCPVTPELDCWFCVGGGHLTFRELPSMRALGDDPHAAINAYHAERNGWLKQR